MGKIQNTCKSLLRRVAVATGAGLLAVVAGLGIAPAGADDEATVEAETTVEAEASESQLRTSKFIQVDGRISSP